MPCATALPRFVAADAIDGYSAVCVAAAPANSSWFSSWVSIEHLPRNTLALDL